MPPIPNRDELERQYTRALSRLLQKYGGNLLEKLGDPPSLDNIPPEFWDDEAQELLRVLRPFGERVYLDAAQMMISEGLDIGIDWSLVNERAADWAAQYTGELVRGIDRTTRDRVANAVSRYYRDALTRGELEEQIMRAGFGPSRAENIAVTEITRAASEGEQGMARELANQGIRMIPMWQTNNDELVCPLCGPRHNKEITDGVYPPMHPRCRCWVTYELQK